MALPTSVKYILYEAIERYDLLPYQDEIEQLARLCFLLRVQPAKKEEDISVGLSKLGGCPDLPSNFDWPQGKWGHMEFLAQINFAQLPDIPHPLPQHGMLWFFSETEGASTNEHNLTYLPIDSNQLSRRVSPASEMMSREDEWSINPNHPLEVTEFVPFVSLTICDASEELFNDNIEANERYQDMVAQLLVLPGENASSSKLLGYPNMVWDGLDYDFQNEEFLTIESTIVDGEWYALFWDAGHLCVTLSANQIQEMNFDGSQVSIFSP